VFKGALRSALEHDLPHQVLTSEELTQRYPGYRLPRESMALFQPDGGFLLPERCIVSYVEAAHAEGAEIHGREAVLEWQPITDGVRVVTDRGSYEADRLVVTAGAWNASLLPVLGPYAVPERQVLAWFQPDRPELFTPDRFPVFNMITDEGRFYGFPVFGIPGFKIGKYHHFEEQGLPESLDREPHWTDEAVLREFTARHFPQAAGPTMTLRSCMFTNTPDNHFIIDVHPEYPQVSFASACSGHGFKFGSVVGEILADLAERGQSRHNIELFRLDRFTGRPSDRPRPGQVAARPPYRRPDLPRRPWRPDQVGGRPVDGRPGSPVPGAASAADAAGRRERPGWREQSAWPRRSRPDGWTRDGYASTITEEGLDALRPFW
jgi:sarcosine oxidase